MTLSDQLPVLTCDGCGACCMEQGSPPGFILMTRDDDTAREWRESYPEDAERFDKAPKEAHSRLRRYIARLVRGEVSGEGACCWFNQKTRQCRYYDWRPQICRDLEVGCDGCLSWRKAYEIA